MPAPTASTDSLPRRLLQGFAARTSFRGRTRLVRALGQYLVPPERIVTGRTDDGLVMRLDLRDPMQFDMYYGLYEPWTRRLIRALLGPGDVMFDLGAHVGYYTLAAAQCVGQAGAVHAFEALPANADALQANVMLNGFSQARVNRAAVSDTDGELELRVPTARDHNTGGAATIMDYFPHAQSVTVPAVALDTYIQAQGIGEIALIKMDIEAAEVRALQGMARTLEQHPPRRILSEVNTIRLRDAGYAPDVIQSLLAGCGYIAWRGGEGQLVRAGQGEAREGVENLLFVREGDALLPRGPSAVEMRELGCG